MNKLLLSHRVRILTVSCGVLLLCSGWGCRKDPKASFEKIVLPFTDNLERILSEQRRRNLALADDWVRQNRGLTRDKVPTGRRFLSIYTYIPDSAHYDVVKTDSLVTPFDAYVRFQLTYDRRCCYAIRMQVGGKKKIIPPEPQNPTSHTVTATARIAFEYREGKWQMYRITWPREWVLPTTRERLRAVEEIEPCFKAAFVEAKP